MARFSWLVACCVWLGSSPFAAASDGLDVAGRTIRVEPPSGFCKLDRADFAGAGLASDFGRSEYARVLTVAGDCADLDAIRNGRRNGPTRLFVALAHRPDDDLEGAIVMLTGPKSLMSFDDRLVDDVLRHFPSKHWPDIAMSHGQSFGMIAEDDTALVGGIARFEGIRTAPWMLHVAGFTIVNETVVSITFVDATIDRSTFDRLLRESRAALANL